MAIIYTYPVKTTPVGNDLILISDSADSNKTKQIKVSSLPSSGAGISLTTTGTSGPAELNGTVLNIPNYATGGTPSLPLNGVQYRNANGNFDATSNLIYHPTQNELSVKHTVIVKGQGNLLPAGKLKLNCELDSHAVTLEGPAHSGGANYTLKFPSAAPTNNQILEYTTSGSLGWIPTPSGGGGGTVTSVAALTIGTSGIDIGSLVATPTTTPVITLNVPDASSTARGALTSADFSTFNAKQAALVSGTNIKTVNNNSILGAGNLSVIGGDVGFTPMSIYEGQDLVGSGGAGGVGNAVTFARQTVVENQCTINSVDFFRLDGDQDISVHVYEGTIANSSSSTLVLSGTESGGNINEINKLTFNKAGYTSHTFDAGTSVVILVSFDYLDGTSYSNAVGHDDLYRVPNLSQSGNNYINSTSIPLGLTDTLDFLGNGCQWGVSLHFYNKPA